MMRDFISETRIMKTAIAALALLLAAFVILTFIVTIVKLSGHGVGPTF